MLFKVYLRQSVGMSSSSGVGVRLKVGINIEKIEGVGSGEGPCPPQLGSGSLPPEKKIILR